MSLRPPCPPSLRHPQGGAILPYILVVMVVVLGMAGMFINSVLVQESRAVEESLARERANLLFESLSTYVTNRALRAEFATDAAKLDALVGYLGELNGISIANATVRVLPPIDLGRAPLAKRVAFTMRYPAADEGWGPNVYAFRVHADVIDVNTADDDRFRLEFTLAAPVLLSGERLVPVLQGLEKRVPGLEVLFYTNTESQTRRLHQATHP